MDIEGEDAEEKMRLLNDVDEISDRLSDCIDEWQKTTKDQPLKRKDTLRVLDLLEPEMMELSLEFGREVTHDLRLFVGKARELLDRPVDEWGADWTELIADCDQFEKDMHSS